MTTEESLKHEISELKKQVRELENKPMSIEGEILFFNRKKDQSKTDKPFFTRMICLDTSTFVNGTRYPGSASFQLIGDKCDMIDGLSIGDKIKVTFSIRGNVYDDTKADISDENKIGNPKGQNCITNLQGYKIDIIAKGSGVPAATSNSNTANNAGNGSASPSPETVDDLPF